MLTYLRAKLQCHSVKGQLGSKSRRMIRFTSNYRCHQRKRKIKGDNTIIKMLHNLYNIGKLFKAQDGLITVTHTDPFIGPSQAILIPTSLYPGLIQALHNIFTVQVTRESSKKW